MERRRIVYRGPWRIELTQRDGAARLLPDSELARTLERALRAAHAPEPAAIGLILTTDQEIAALNATHMGHAGPTDVLSFPLLAPAQFAVHPGKSGGEEAAGPLVPAEFVRPSGRVHLGEIVISVERAIEQATEGRGGHSGDVPWSPADELRLLVTHGVLHICGWDHAQPVEERAMRELESQLLGMPLTR